MRSDGIPQGGIPSVLFIGAATHAEFAEPAGWLAHRVRLTLADSPLAAMSRIRIDDPPHAIVLAQARPGQFRRAEVERLLKLAPLARVSVLLGGWCEGETRTGEPWPGVDRIYWHQSIGRLQSELVDGADQPQAVWQLPRTTTPNERFLWWADHALPTLARQVAIVAAQYADFAPLHEACTALGCQAVWAQEVRRVPPACDLLLLDLPGDARRIGAAVADWRQAAGDADVIALLDFPRQADDRAAREAGACGVLSKPFLLTDLAGLIRQTERRRRPAA